MPGRLADTAQGSDLGGTRIERLLQLPDMRTRRIEFAFTLLQKTL